MVSIGEVSLGHNWYILCPMIMEVENGYLQVRFSVGSCSVQNDENW